MGFGLLLWLLLAFHAGGYVFPVLPSATAGTLFEFLSQSFIVHIGLAVVIFTTGLMSSTFHLANPKNAWRSFTRFRSSWLSREAVFAVMLYPLILAYVASLWFNWSVIGSVLGLLIGGTLLVLLYCTAMIYASLKTIPQWHNPWVVPSFMFFSMTSGLIAYNALMPNNDLIDSLCMLFLAAGLLLKLGYFHSLGAPTISNINTATGFALASQASVTLFDTGHSSRNFSEREFMYTVGPKTTGLARKLSLALAFILPAVFLFFAWVWLALMTHYLGMLLERWLFFVEAKHVVRHYYGQ